MARNRFLRKIAILVASLFSVAHAREVIVFDVAEQVIHLPLSGQEERSKKLGLGTNCRAYKRFVVKSHNPGQKGDNLSLIPRPNEKIPECLEQVMANEIPLTSWSGTFLGAKDKYAFFNGDDLWNGGFGFSIFEGPTGEKIFEDAYVDRFQKVELHQENFLLQYVRVYDPKCSAIEEPEFCLKKIRAETGLSKTQTQKFLNSAKRLHRKILADLKKKLPDLSENELRKNHIGGSIIHYPVTVKIEKGKAFFTPRNGKISAQFSI